MQPHTPDPTDITLVAAITRRRTDRRIYSARPVPAGDIALMGARAARLEVMLRQIDTMDKLNQIVKQAVRDRATNHDYLVEVTLWSGRYGESPTGVPARNTPQHDCTAPIPGRIFAGPGLVQPLGAAPAEDNAVVLMLGTEADDRLSQLRAGEGPAWCC